jgi:hypothetical protein
MRARLKIIEIFIEIFKEKNIKTEIKYINPNIFNKIFFSKFSQNFTKFIQSAKFGGPDFV